MELQAQTSQTQTFNASCRRLRMGVLGIGALWSLLFIAVAVPSLWARGASVGVAVAFTAGFLVVVWLIPLPLAWFILDHYRRKQRLHIGPDGVCRQEGAVRQLVPWAAMTRVRVHQVGDSAGGRRHERLERLKQHPTIGKVLRALVWLTPEPPEPSAVEVYTAEGRALFLHEFERMDEIARLLQSGVSREVQVERVGLFG
jgi:hypothetical protein